MSEVYEVGRKSFEDMTEMLLNNKNISNDQRRGLRETYVLSKREEYCLIGKSDDEVEEIIRKKSPKDRLSMMKCFKVPYSQRKRCIAKSTQIIVESNLKDSKLIIFMESIYPYHTTSTKQHNK